MPYRDESLHLPAAQRLNISDADHLPKVYKPSSNACHDFLRTFGSPSASEQISKESTVDSRIKVSGLTRLCT